MIIDIIALLLAIALIYTLIKQHNVNNKHIDDLWSVIDNHMEAIVKLQNDREEVKSPNPKE